MGLIDTTMMNGTPWNMILKVPAEGMWAMLMLALAVSVAGILLNVTTDPGSRRRPLRLAMAGTR